AGEGTTSVNPCTCSPQWCPHPALRATFSRCGGRRKKGGLDEYCNWQYIANRNETRRQDHPPQNPRRSGARTRPRADPKRSLASRPRGARWSDQPVLPFAAGERDAASSDEQHAPAACAILQGPPRLSRGRSGRRASPDQAAARPRRSHRSLARRTRGTVRGGSAAEPRAAADRETRAVARLPVAARRDRRQQSADRSADGADDAARSRAPPPPARHVTASFRGTSMTTLFMVCFFTGFVLAVVSFVSGLDKVSRVGH